MNYFELYPGDYLRDTTRLTLVEHGAYLRLLLAYYGEEEPLPADFPELYLIAGAHSATEKEAVRKVAEKHFPVGPDGLRHNKKADEIIAQAKARMEAAPDKKANEAERQRRHRERRAELFEQLRAVGIVPPMKTTTAELERLVTQHVTRDNGRDERDASRDGHAPVTRHITATRPQTPDPTYPSGNNASTGGSEGAPNPAGLACRLMRQAGCTGTNPAHPELIAALAAGVAPETLAATAAEAIADGKAKPFAWACVTARSRHLEGPRDITANPPRARQAEPSYMAKGVAAILGVSPHDVVENPAGTVVRAADRHLPGEPVPPVAGRLTGS